MNLLTICTKHCIKCYRDKPESLVSTSLSFKMCAQVRGATVYEVRSESNLHQSPRQDLVSIIRKLLRVTGHSNESLPNGTLGKASEEPCGL